MTPLRTLLARAIAAAGITAAIASSIPPAAAVSRSYRLPVVFDHDADFDDTAALAALAAQHVAGRIELRAVTVINDGAGLPGKAYRHTRCLLNQLGLADVPVADATYGLPNVFPDWLRQAFDQLLDTMIQDCQAGRVPPPMSASNLLADVLTRAPGQVVVVATGPVTNIARAIETVRQRRGWPAALLVRAAYVMGGGFDPDHADPSLLPPGFDGTQNINTWVDAAASQSVFRAFGPKLRLVADATSFAPITLSYIQRLTAKQRTSAAAYVAELMNQPFIQGGLVQQGGSGCCWWDPVTAISALEGFFDPIVHYQPLRVSVVQHGPQEGRTIVVPNGIPILVGLSADGPLFEDKFLDRLNGR